MVHAVACVGRSLACIDAAKASAQVTGDTQANRRSCASRDSKTAF